MADTQNTYQIAGLDHLDRGFNRQAEVRVVNDHYHAIFRYEQFQLEVEGQETEKEAITTLIQRLQEQGYSQLRSRLHFRGEQYLGNQELWEDHPDQLSSGFFLTLMRLLRNVVRNSFLPGNLKR